MDQSLQIVCELCGAQSDVIKNSYVDPSGSRVEWPRATVKPDGIYFTINCPYCGERDQCLVRPDDTD